MWHLQGGQDCGCGAAEGKGPRFRCPRALNLLYLFASVTEGPAALYWEKGWEDVWKVRSAGVRLVILRSWKEYLNRDDGGLKSQYWAALTVEMSFCLLENACLSSGEPHTLENHSGRNSRSELLFPKMPLSVPLSLFPIPSSSPASAPPIWISLSFGLLFCLFSVFCLNLFYLLSSSVSCSSSGAKWTFISFGRVSNLFIKVAKWCFCLGLTAFHRLLIAVFVFLALVMLGV